MEHLIAVAAVLAAATFAFGVILPRSAERIDREGREASGGRESS